MDIKNFLDKKKYIAVVGVSQNRDKWGYKIYKALKKENFNVVPLNPNCNQIDNEVCYSYIEELPFKPDVVVTVVKPHVTEIIVRQCINQKIEYIWMQPGSESQGSLSLCEDNNVKYISGKCILYEGINSL